MLQSIVYLIVGLLLIMYGASWLTDGASSVARRMGVSDLVIGLTIVAFGTSAPELAISVISAIDGSAELAIGNVVGSNIFNILVIIGITAIVAPIKVERSILSAEMPLVLLSALALLAIGASPYLGGGTPVVSRTDGILLLLFFAIFMRYVFAQARKGGVDTSGDTKPTKEIPMWKSALMIAAGLGGLICGGDRFVDGASGIASAMGVSQAVIGLTVVAAGTSLPELATSIVAARRGRPGMAIGNVIGSNIFNIFMVLGASAVVRPLPFGDIGITELLVLTAACLLFWLEGLFWRQRTITRGEGALLLALYIAYTTWLVINA